MMGRYAIRATLMALFLGVVMIFLHGQGVYGAEYKVGGKDLGWTFDVLGWEKGNNFKAGDVLVFNYDTDLHSVVRVNKASYDKCIVPPKAPILKSGNDRVTLVKGPNYFVCGTMGHCDAGMQIAPFAS